ncbi:unnamed protein product [Candidula unifasciata]|uniref:UBA domain-containing protein n=1 Tax=Candidula unifasciata TaxID=100452 RepID=A0A8S3ZXC6_9EUPU|nr:unnamed protein product [Candidula unifasciata]
MNRSVGRKRGQPNRGGGRANRAGGQRGRGRGGPRGSVAPRGAGGRGGWSSSRKGGLDLDDSLDGPVLNDPYYDSHEEDHRSFGTKRGRGQGSFPKVKVEMQQLDMTKENQMMVKDTLLSLQSGDRDGEFSFTDQGMDYEDDGEDDDGDDDDGPVHDELDPNVENRYWIPDRRLVIQDAVTFNASLNDSKSGAQSNIFAIKKLQRCGFSQDLCQEALQICEGDTGAALEYLLNELFNINLTVSEDEDVGGGQADVDQEILEAREEEMLALQSIYDCDFEECIPNKIWLLNLKLPELHQLLDSRSPIRTREESGETAVSLLP